MSKKLYEETSISDIADAIREKNGTVNTYTIAQMPSAVRAITGEGREAVIQPLSVTQNGTYNPPSGVDGYTPVVVNVSAGNGLDVAVVNASSSFSSEYTADKAFINGFWGSTGNNPEWLQMTFQNPVKITGITFSNTLFVGNLHWSSVRVIFQASSDGSSWIDLYDAQNLSDNVENLFTFSVPNSNNYLYYRFLCYKGSFYAGLGNVQVSYDSGGGSIAPSLPYSDQSKILASAYPGNYSDDNPTWGGLEVIKSNIGLIKNSDFIYLRDNSFAKIDLGEPNHSFVAYLVGLVLSGGQWPVAIGTLYENSFNNSIALCSNSERICYTHFGNTIAQTSFSSIKTFVGALRIDGTNKLSSCFVNGEQIAQPSSFNNSGQYCSFGAFSNSTYFANLFIKYLAVVDGLENDSTIISNQQHLMNLYGIE